MKKLVSTKRTGKDIDDFFDELENGVPKDEWICDACGALNDKWIVRVSYLYKRTGDKYMKAQCENCVRLEDEKKAEYEKQKRIKDRLLRVNSLIIKSKIPERIKNIKIENIRVRKGAEKVFEMVKRFTVGGNWIYIYGKNSTGKTVLMGALVNMLVDRLIPVVYINEAMFFDRLRKTWDKNSNETESDLFSLFTGSRVVIWDEFAFTSYFRSGQPTYKYEQVYSIIEYCSENNIMMVFVSNVSNDKIEERAGQRIFARLKRHRIEVYKMENNPYF